MIMYYKTIMYANNTAVFFCLVMEVSCVQFWIRNFGSAYARILLPKIEDVRIVEYCGDDIATI